MSTNAFTIEVESSSSLGLAQCSSSDVSFTIVEDFFSTKATLTLYSGQIAWGFIEDLYE